MWPTYVPQLQLDNVWGKFGARQEAVWMDKVTGYVPQNGDPLVAVFMGRYAVESITFTGTGGL